LKTDYSRSEVGSQKRIPEQGKRVDYAEALEYLTDRFISYEFCYSEETGFLESSSMEHVKDNAFIAMLRRDYIDRAGGKLRGKELDRVIRAFMEQAKKFLTDRLHDANFKEFTREISV
jgi:hypothetical protein